VLVPNTYLPRLLIAIGLFFLASSALLAVNLLRYARLRPTAVLTWRLPRPGSHALFAAMAFVLALLIVVKLGVQRRPPLDVFGETMMLLYFGALAPLTRRIERGFYGQGLWLDDGFLPYSRIGGLAWREGEKLTLVAVPRGRQVAHRLVVPQRHYGQARRLLRDLIATHRIQFHGELDLGGHDAREDV
jgi:hypothetical protein